MKNFEQEAKNRLNHYDSPVDTDRLWAGIDESLRGKKRRRIAGWWWWAGACLLVGTALVAYYAVNDHGSTQHPANPAAAPQSVQNNQQALAHASENTNSPNVVFNTDPIIPSPIANHTPKAPTPGSRRSVYEKEQTFTSVNQALPKQQVSGASATGIDTKTSASATLIEGQSSSTLQPTIEKTTVIAQLPGIQFLPVNKQSGNFPKPDTKKVECFNWKTKPRWHIGIYGTSGYPLKKLTAQNDEFADLTADRNQTEKVLEAVGGGFYAGIRFKNKWLIESGVDYLRINERFTRTNTTVDTIGKTLIVSYIVNAPGDTTFTQGESYIIQTTKASRKTYNHYNTLNLPIALGYEWAMGQHFSANLKAGAAVNLHFSQKAEIATGNQQSVLYQNGQPATDYPFRARLGVIPFAEFGMRWSFADRMSLSGSVHYRYFVRPFNVATSPVEQRYQLAGARIGLQYQL